MAATPTVISKTREQVYIPPEYTTREVTRCYDPPPAPNPSDPPPRPPPSGGGENCQVIVAYYDTGEFDENTGQRILIPYLVEVCN